MVTYGGMSKKPITVSTTSFIFKVSLVFPLLVITKNVRFFGYRQLWRLYLTAELKVN